jgi:hypothetical protein
VAPAPKIQKEETAMDRVAALLAAHPHLDYMDDRFVVALNQHKNKTMAADHPLRKYAAGILNPEAYEETTDKMADDYSLPEQWGGPTAIERDVKAAKEERAAREQQILQESRQREEEFVKQNQERDTWARDTESVWETIRKQNEKSDADLAAKSKLRKAKVDALLGTGPVPYSPPSDQLPSASPSADAPSPDEAAQTKTASSRKELDALFAETPEGPEETEEARSEREAADVAFAQLSDEEKEIAQQEEEHRIREDEKQRVWEEESPARKEAYESLRLTAIEAQEGARKGRVAFEEVRRKSDEQLAVLQAERRAREAGRSMRKAVTWREKVKEYK